MTERSPAVSLQRLLDDLCREWGFCARLRAADLLRPDAVLGAGDFAGVVLRAEGMDPETEKRWVRRIADRFTERFGPSGLACG